MIKQSVRPIDCYFELVRFQLAGIVRNDVKLHIHHPSLVKRLGFLYYVTGDVYELEKYCMGNC